MVSKPKVVFFDLGETLVTQNIEDNLVTQRALNEVSNTLPKRVSGRMLYTIYQKGFRKNHDIRSRHHVEIPVQVWMLELLQRALGEEPSEGVVSQAIQIIVKNRATNSVAFKDARPILTRLAQKRIPMGIISNVSSDEVAQEILKHVKLNRYFDHLITSAYAGIRKPDPGIFLFALRKFRTRPDQAIHVGDSEFHDIRGANPVGLTTLLVKSGEAETGTDADYRFRSLAEAADTLVNLASG